MTVAVEICSKVSDLVGAVDREAVIAVDPFDAKRLMGPGKMRDIGLAAHCGCEPEVLFIAGEHQHHRARDPRVVPFKRLAARLGEHQLVAILRRGRDHPAGVGSVVLPLDDRSPNRRSDSCLGEDLRELIVGDCSVGRSGVAWVAA